MQLLSQRSHRTCRLLGGAAMTRRMASSITIYTWARAVNNAQPPEPCSPGNCCSNPRVLDFICHLHVFNFLCFILQLPIKAHFSILHCIRETVSIMVFKFHTFISPNDHIISSYHHIIPSYPVPISWFTILPSIHSPTWGEVRRDRTDSMNALQSIENQLWAHTRLWKQ